MIEEKERACRKCRLSPPAPGFVQECSIGAQVKGSNSNESSRVSVQRESLVNTAIYRIPGSGIERGIIQPVSRSSLYQLAVCMEVQVDLIELRESSESKKKVSRGEKIGVMLEIFDSRVRAHAHERTCNALRLAFLSLARSASYFASLHGVILFFLQKKQLWTQKTQPKPWSQWPFELKQRCAPPLSPLVSLSKAC